MKHQNGLTLIELLVTVAVVSILLAVGVPAYQTMTENNRLVATVNHLVGTLNMARSEAVKRSRPISVCASTNGVVCDNTADWTVGWIAFIDQNRDGAADDANAYVARQGTIAAGLQLTATEFDDNTLLRFLPNGRLEQPAGGNDPDGTFVLCDTRNRDATRARAINVNALGRVMLAQDPDGSGIRNNVENVDIACP